MWKIRLSERVTRNDIILGYIEPKTFRWPIVGIESNNLEYKITEKEIVNPTKNRYFNIVTNQHIYVVPNIRYKIISSSSAPVLIQLYNFDNEISSSITISYVKNGTHYVGYFNTNSDTVYIRTIFPSGVYPSYFNIFKDNIALKYNSKQYLYTYTSRYKFASDDIKIIDTDGNIYGLDYYTYNNKDGYLQIESNIISNGKCELVYDAIVDNNIIINYHEAIDASYISNVSILEDFAEYGISSFNDKLLLIGNDNIPNLMLLALREIVYSINDSNNKIVYTINPEMDYTVLPNGSKSNETSKIIKENVTILEPNLIKTNHNIICNTFEYDKKYIPTNLIDLSTPINTYGEGDKGITIFIDGTPYLNSDIISEIFPDSGLIRLNNDLNTANVYATYTTSPFSIIGTLSSLNITSDNVFYITPSLKYNVLYDLTEEQTLNSPYISKNKIILTTGTSYSSSFVSDNPNYKLFLSIYADNNLKYTISNNSTIFASGTVATNNTYVTTTFTDIPNSFNFTLENTGTTSVTIYDLQLRLIVNNSGSIYYNKNGYNVSLLDSNNILSYKPADAINVGILNFQDNTDDTYEYYELMFRGGGLIDDDIIMSYFKQPRFILVPESVEYGDIGSTNNKPMNERKFIIVTLPLSIIDDLIEKRIRLNEGIEYITLRQWAVNTVYQKIRSILPAGVYFKIYDENNQPWPSEKAI